MKKTLLKILTLCLTLCCALCLFTACGENGQVENTDNAESENYTVYVLCSSDLTTVDESHTFSMDSKGNWRNSEGEKGVYEIIENQGYQFKKDGETEIYCIGAIQDGYLGLSYLNGEYKVYKLKTAVTPSGGTNGGTNGGNSQKDNKYYYINDQFEFEKDKYFTINKNGTWSNSDNESGTYTTEQDGFVIYYFTLKDDEEFSFVGTIENDYLILVYGEDANKIEYYAKDTVNPSGGGSAVPEAKKVKVTYNANGGQINGNNTYEERVVVGSKLTAPNNPVRIGYTFSGWAFDRNGNKKCVFENEIISADTVLYATWTEEKAVILSVENATISDRTVTVVVENNITSLIFSDKVTVSSDCSWKMYLSDGHTEVPTKLANNLQTGKNSYYIVVTSNDGLNSHTYTLNICRVYDVAVSYYVKNTLVYATTFQMYKENSLDYVPSVNGYNFNGWRDKDGNAIAGNKLVLDENNYLVAFYADITPINYNIEYELNGGTNNADNPNKYNIESQTITLRAPTKTGYTFDGWYSAADFTGETTQITSGSYGNKKFYAKWVYYTLTTNRDYTSAGEVTSYNGTKITVGDSVTITATTNTGYTFVGWYNGEQELTKDLSYTFIMPNENITYTAKWINSPITLNKNINEAGTVSISENQIIGKAATVTATTNAGYTWVGWYNGEQELTKDLSYTFIMPNANVTYIAKWCKLTLAVNDSNAGSISILTGKYFVGDSVTITATTNTGYTFVGWYNGEQELTKDLSYTFNMPDENITYTAKWIYYTLTTNRNDMSAGTVTAHNQTKITAGESVTVSATTNIGYTWVGWYNGEQELSKDLSYTFKMPDANITYTAKWSKVTLAVNNSTVGSVSTLTGKYFVGDNVTVTATTKQEIGYTFIGWYNGNEKLTSELTYTFAMPNENLILTAKWEEVNFTYTQTSSGVTLTGIKDKTVTEIIVPDYVTAINQGAFSGCSNLVSLTIPFVGGSRKTASGNYQYPFGYIFGTSSYTGGKETTQYYYGINNSETCTAYYIPTSLKSVTVTGGNILYGAFYGCSDLTSVTIPNGVTNIGHYAFKNCSSLTSINIPDSVAIIGASVFYNCSSLRSITIPNSVTNMWQNVFYNCSSLESITIPDSVTSIGNYSFHYCTSLTHVTIGSSVTSIGNYAFIGCSGLTSVTIGNSVTSIGRNAFSYCYKLVEVINKSSLTITKGSGGNGEIGYYALTIHNGESKIVNRNGYLFITDNGTNYLLGYSGTETKLTLPSDYNGQQYQIYKYAFNNCSGLTSVTIGNSVTSIGNYAFNNCSSLTSVTIPNSVTNIGEYAFDDCNSLTSVTFANTSGWKVSTNSDMSNATSLYSGDLANTSTAATYLKSKYYYYYWKRG